MADYLNIFYVSLGLFIGSFFSYYLQYFLGGKLSVADYGSFNGLLAIANILSVPSAVLTTALIKKVAEMNSKKETGVLNWLFKELTKYILFIGLTLFIVFLLFSSYISKLLQVDSANTVAFFGLYLGASYLLILPSSYLQGFLRYKTSAFYGSVSSLLRLLGAVLMVLAGFKLNGTFLGIFFATVTSYFLGYYLLKKNFGNNQPQKNLQIIRDLIKFSLPILIVNLSMIIFNNVDLITVKSYFDPEIAGYYAGTVTLGKILLFGASSITVVMFPKIAAIKAEGKNVYATFKKFLILQLIILGTGVLSFMLIPNVITNLFFQEKFNHSIQFLPLYSLFVGLYVILNFLTMFMLAIDKVNVLKYLFLAAIVQIIALVINHQSIYHIIFDNLIAVILALAFLIYSLLDDSVHHNSSI